MGKSHTSGRDSGALVFDGELQQVVVEPINPTTQSRGFVFAKHAGGREVFLHRTMSFADPEEFDRLIAGQVIRCRIRDTHKGWRAVDAQRVE